MTLNQIRIRCTSTASIIILRMHWDLKCAPPLKNVNINKFLKTGAVKELKNGLSTSLISVEYASFTQNMVSRISDTVGFNN